MSSVEIARRGFVAFSERDLETLLAMFTKEIDPSARLVMRPSWSEREHVYEGAEGVQKVRAALERELDDLRQDIVSVEEAGEHAIVIYRQSGRHRHSLREDVVELAQLWRFEDGKVVEVRVFDSPDGARDAAREPTGDQRA